MVKIFSPYSGGDSLGASIAKLGQQMFGDTTGNALNSEKLYDAQRTNAETDNLMKRIAGGGGAQMLASDPVTQALMVASGYKPRDFGDMGLLGAATQFGATDPRTQNFQVGTGQSYDNTSDAFNTKQNEVVRNNNLQSGDRRYGVDQNNATELYKFGNVSANDVVKNDETRRNNNMQSSDRLYGDNLASKDRRYEFDNKPIAAIGPSGPAFVPQSGATAPGIAPVMSETDQKGTLLGKNFDNLATLDPMQRQVLGANPTEAGSRTPKNYISNGKSFITYDGVTEAGSGQPLPPGGYIGTVQGDASGTGLTNAVTSDVQKGIIANNKFGAILAATREAATKDPNNFGLPGFIKGTAQDINQIAQNLAQGFGFKDAQTAIDTAAASAIQNGIDPNLISGVFDPNLSELHTLADLMVYQAAEALAGQSGRSVSDKDVLMFKKIVGDPRDWMMTQQKFLSKMAQVDRILQISQNTLNSAQHNGAVSNANPVVPPSSADVPAPAPQGGAPVVHEEWGRGPDGSLQRIK